MPLVHFSKEIQVDAKLLVGLEDQLLHDFANLALKNVMTGGINPKIYAKAAASLKKDAETVERAIMSLSHAFLECAKKNIQENDFLVSINDLNFSGDQAELLSKHYLPNVRHIREFLSDMSMKLPHYQNLDWRLDVQLATRCLRQQVQPSLLLELECHDAAGEKEVTVLQADHANLQHMVNELEAAVAEARNKHCMRITRYVK